MVPSWVLAGLAVFATIFLVEFFDRTNLVVISLSAQHRPRDVWIGATLGFALAAGIAVVIGALFLAVLAPHLFYVRLVGGVLVAGYGAWSLLRSGKEEGEARPPLPARTVIAQAFLLIALLEMGDTTQILTLLFVTSVGDPLLVFVAATLALASTAAFGTRMGGYLKDRLSRRTIERTSAALILVVGAVLVLLAFYPIGA